MFGNPSNQSNSLFGTPNPQSSIFGSANNNPSNPSGCLFGGIKPQQIIQGQGGLFGKMLQKTTVNNNIDNKPISSGGLFGQPVVFQSNPTLQTGGLFGSKGGSVPSNGLFASNVATTLVPNNQTKSDLFRSVKNNQGLNLGIQPKLTSNSLFGGVKQNITNESKQSTGLFGSNKNVQVTNDKTSMTGLFSSSISSSANEMITTGFFGNKPAQTGTNFQATPTGLFGSVSAVDQAKKSASGGLFAQINKKQPLIDTKKPNNAEQSSLFGEVKKTQNLSLFEKSSEVQTTKLSEPSKGGLFGLTNHKVTEAKNKPQSLFKSTGTGLFDKNKPQKSQQDKLKILNQTSGLFGDIKKTTQTSIPTLSNLNPEKQKDKAIQVKSNLFGTILTTEVNPHQKKNQSIVSQFRQVVAEPKQLRDPELPDQYQPYTKLHQSNINQATSLFATNNSVNQNLNNAPLQAATSLFSGERASQHITGLIKQKNLINDQDDNNNKDNSGISFSFQKPAQPVIKKSFFDRKIPKLIQPLLPPQINLAPSALRFSPSFQLQIQKCSSSYPQPQTKKPNASSLYFPIDYSYKQQNNSIRDGLKLNQTRDNKDMLRNVFNGLLMEGKVTFKDTQNMLKPNYFEQFVQKRKADLSNQTVINPTYNIVGLRSIFNDPANYQTQDRTDNLLSKNYVQRQSQSQKKYRGFYAQEQQNQSSQLDQQSDYQDQQENPDYSQQSKERVPPMLLPISPQHLTLYPSIHQLSKLSASELHNIFNVKISSQYGIIEYLQPITLYKKKLIDCVQIEQDTININDQEWNGKMAKLTFFNFGYYNQLDQRGKLKIQNKIINWVRNYFNMTFQSFQNGQLTVIINQQSYK